MGKIISPPKMPDPVIIEAPPPPPPPPEPAENTELTEEQIRVQNMLSRKRGRLGTIATSFNGILNDATGMAPARKTLLGE